MPSFQDSALIFFIALLLFGPKKLPELARQLGKLMGEFRRASNEFRMQMEDELRLAEQTEQQKKIADMEAAAPVTPALPDTDLVASSVNEGNPEPNPEATPELNSASIPGSDQPASEESPVPAPLPIATSGDLSIMPPDTGLPRGRSSVSGLFDAVPHDPTPDPPDRRDPEMKTISDSGAFNDHGAPVSPEEASLHG